MVVAGVLPVDRPDGDGPLARGRPDLHTVTEPVVDRAVGVVEGLAAAEGGRLLQIVERPRDDPVAVSAAPEPIPEQALLDVPVVRAVLPMAKVVVAEDIPEEADHPPLRAGLPLADRRHAFAPSDFWVATES